jgi:hypothetical protein
MRVTTRQNLCVLWWRVTILVLALLASGTQHLNAQEKRANRFSFVVLGHIRGDDNGQLNPLFDELLVKVGKRAPDMIFLTGDMIWGDVNVGVPDAAAIKRDWDRLDAALAQLGVPVYRVPGNHDINDPVTRDIYFARYGQLPQAITYRGNRFILLNSSWVPEGSESPPVPRPYIRGKQLGPEQIGFIRNELSDRHRYDHVFLFVHHMLWWHREEAAWWREVHPLLVAGNVRAVFGGDYGPMKFSHMSRDGIDYFQCSIEGNIGIQMLRGLISSRLLSQQFDNFLYVRVDSSHVTVDVETVGEISSGKFTPQRWRAINEYEPPKKSLEERLWDVVGSPGSPRRQLVVFASVMVICFLAGVVAMRIWYRRKAV